MDSLNCEVKYQGQTETMKCACCGKSYKTQKGLQEHKCTFCQVCKRRFRNVKVFSTHTCTVAYDTNKLHNERCSTSKTYAKTTGNQKISNMTCNFCGRLFKTGKSLRGHKCSYCSICKKIYSNFRRYKEHKCDILKTNDPEHEDKGNHKANRHFC